MYIVWDILFTFFSVFVDCLENRIITYFNNISTATLIWIECHFYSLDFRSLYFFCSSNAISTFDHNSKSCLVTQTLECFILRMHFFVCVPVCVQVLKKLKCAFNTSTRRKYKKNTQFLFEASVSLPFFSTFVGIKEITEIHTIIAIKYQMWNIHVQTINTKWFFFLWCEGLSRGMGIK